MNSDLVGFRQFCANPKSEGFLDSFKLDLDSRKESPNSSFFAVCD